MQGITESDRQLGEEACLSLELLFYWQDCCVVESMQAMEAAAKQNGKQFELVVYPKADHGFNLKSGAHGEPAGAYRRDDDRDAWRRTVEMLKRYQPLG